MATSRGATKIRPNEPAHPLGLHLFWPDFHLATLPVPMCRYTLVVACREDFVSIAMKMANPQPGLSEAEWLSPSRRRIGEALVSRHFSSTVH
jgi:hypothetical protein